MPYIPQTERARAVASPRTPGELNFVLTLIAIEYVHEHKLSYSTISEVMGAFACAAQEFYRRVAADYEDLKVITNGDVYPLSFPT